MLTGKTGRETLRIRGKLLLSVGFVAVSAAYVYWQHQGQFSNETVTAKSSAPGDNHSVPFARAPNSIPAGRLPQMALAAAPARALPAHSSKAVAPRADATTAGSAITQSSPMTPSGLAEGRLDASSNEAPAPVREADANASFARSSAQAAPEPPQRKERYNDGEFVGDPASTVWGDVQVKAVIRNGAITDVQFLDYPTHRRRSAEINSWATPILTSEAIRVQSAEVDIVSQASVTAFGFEQSLASALMRAQK